VLIARVRRTIRERDLIPPHSQIVCACSGGPDSAVLLFTLAKLSLELQFGLVAASVDHGLRADAANDVAIAGRQAAQLGIEFHPLKIDVAPGASLQAKAREARYAALAGLAARLGAVRIAVGHTQDDQAETLLSRLLRGAGVRGLASIEPRRADGVVRPLIDCRRRDVQRLAAMSFPELACDPSNSDQRFERVRIRAHLLPALVAEDRALVRHLAELADDARDCAQVLEALAKSGLERALRDSETLEISLLVREPAALRRAVLRHWLEPLVGSLGRAQMSQLEAALQLRRGEVWISAGRSVHVISGRYLQLTFREVEMART
jgi:tRNA(Ile)-lysidine synthase